MNPNKSQEVLEKYLKSIDFHSFLSNLPQLLKQNEDILD
jgi:hypothetical protein